MLHATTDDFQLAAVLESADARIRELERLLGEGRLPLLDALVDEAMLIVKRLIIAVIRDNGEKMPPEESADLLDVFKVLVKGQPFWNTIRDNCRELVYYRNCLAMERRDALPPAADRMTVRTLRHLFLFIKTQCLKSGRLEA